MGPPSSTYGLATDSHALAPSEAFHQAAPTKSSEGLIAIQQDLASPQKPPSPTGMAMPPPPPGPVVSMRTPGLYTDAACPRPLPPSNTALLTIEKMQLELLKNQQQIQQAQRQIQQNAIQLAAPGSSPAMTPAMALAAPGPFQIRDALPLSSQLSSQFSHLVRNARATKAIAKPPKFGGIPMDRRAVSMDALEVLSSGFM